MGCVQGSQKGKAKDIPIALNQIHVRCAGHFVENLPPGLKTLQSDPAFSTNKLTVWIRKAKLMGKQEVIQLYCYGNKKEKWLQTNYS